MDHGQAQEMKAAERYILGDLSVSQVEEFERHFFDCPACSQDLRFLNLLQENARAFYSDQDRAPEKSHSVWRHIAAAWFRPVVFAPALGGLAVALLIGFQAGAHRQSRDVQAVAAFPLYAAARGDENIITPPPGAQFYTLYMDRTWDADFPSYHAVIREEPGGAEQSSVNLNVSAPGRPMYVLVPVALLRSGRFALVISGVDSGGRQSELALYPFSLKIQ